MVLVPLTVLATSTGGLCIGVRGLPRAILIEEECPGEVADSCEKQALPLKYPYPISQECEKGLGVEMDLYMH